MYQRSRIITAGGKNVFGVINLGPNQINMMTFPSIDVCDLTNPKIKGEKSLTSSTDKKKV